MRIRGWLVLWLLAGAAHIPAASAQVITGTVRDSVTLQPVRGAVVQLLDAAGHASARTITDAGGMYRLPAAADSRTLRIIRLGFRPRELHLGAHQLDERLDVFMGSVPLLLEQVQVTAAGSRCPRRQDRAAAASLLGQVRAGLLASIIGRTAAPAQMTRLHFTRRLDRRGRIASQSVRREVAGAVRRSFGAARTPAAFGRDGFMDSTSTFFAPDAETLVA